MKYNIKELPKEYFVYENFHVRPYKSVAEVNSIIHVNNRIPNTNTNYFPPTVVCIKQQGSEIIEEYWWDGGISDFNLVKKPYMDTVPFDYDKIKEGYKVVTRGGEEITEIHKFSGGEYPIVCFKPSANGTFCAKINGKVTYAEVDSANDLLMIPHTTIKYINIYPSTSEVYASDFKPLSCKVENHSTNHSKVDVLKLKVTYERDEAIKAEIIK